MFSKTELTRFFMAFCLCFPVGIGVGSAVGAYQDGDWQFWTASTLEGNVGQQWKIGFEEQFRFGDDVSEFFYHYTGVGLMWKMTEWFQTGLTYSQVYELKKDDWKEENRPFMDGTIQKTWKGFSLSDRNRFERRMRQDAEDLWRYRNNLTGCLVQKWGPLQIQPYVSGESFFDLIEKGDFNQYRLIGGLKGRLARCLQMDLYYLRQMKEKNSEWDGGHILGLKMKVSL